MIPQGLTTGVQRTHYKESQGLTTGAPFGATGNVRVRIGQRTSHLEPRRATRGNNGGVRMDPWSPSKGRRERWSPVKGRREKRGFDLLLIDASIFIPHPHFSLVHPTHSLVTSLSSLQITNKQFHPYYQPARMRTSSARISSTLLARLSLPRFSRTTRKSLPRWPSTLFSASRYLFWNSE